MPPFCYNRIERKEHTMDAIKEAALPAKELEAIERKRQQEMKSMQEIITLYCHGKQHLREACAGLCPECQHIAGYARSRILGCPRMAEKSFCAVCPIHCYQKKEREQIRKIMRWAGPRMLLRHPLMTLRHIWHQKIGK